MSFSTPRQHPPRARGSLFANDRRTSDSAPDYTGPGSISREAIQALMDAYQGDGLMDDEAGELRIRLAAWEKVSASGRPYLFITVEPHMPAPEQTAAPAAAGGREKGLRLWQPVPVHHRAAPEQTAAPAAAGGDGFLDF